MRSMHFLGVAFKMEEQHPIHEKERQDLVHLNNKLAELIAHLQPAEADLTIVVERDLLLQEVASLRESYEIRFSKAQQELNDLNLMVENSYSCFYFV